MKEQKLKFTNIYFCFIENEWKAFFRGKGLVQETATRILMFIFFILILYSCLIFGDQLKNILLSTNRKVNYLSVFYVIIPIYFFGDLFLRHLWQEVPTVDIISYLHLNINKSILRNYFIFRSFSTIFTIVPIFLFAPFLINHVLFDYGYLQSLLAGVMILSLSSGNHFIILYLKKNAIRNEIVFLLPLVLFVLLWLLNREGVISLTKFVETISVYFYWPITILLFSIFWFLMSFFIMFRNSKTNFYFDPPSTALGKTYFKNFNLSKSQYSFLIKLVETELRMFLRNKRARSLFYTSLFTIVYGFIIFRSAIQPQNGIVFIAIASIIMSGLVVNNYAQSFFAWQSEYFDFLMVINTNIKEIFKSKFIVCYVLCTWSLILLLPLAWKNTNFLLPLLSAYLYNIGVQPILASLFANFNYKAINLNQADNFNYQGLGASQFAYVLANALLAILIYLPFSLIKVTWDGIILIGLVGLVNLILKNWWIGIFTSLFKYNKYRILNGFRIKK